MKSPTLKDGKIDFQYLVENSADILCYASIDRVLYYVSPACVRVLGWSPEEMVGRSADDFVLAEDMPILLQVRANKSQAARIRMIRKDGSTVWMENQISIVNDAVTGEPRDVFLAMRDMTAHKLLEEKLSTQALTDSLTGLGNRRAFDKDLEREWKRTMRESSQLSLLLLDLDHFKAFNDRYGHQAGDDCLRAIADAVAGAVRDTDIVARYGGEEIAIILPATACEGAVETAEKLLSVIRELQIAHEADGKTGRTVTASVGVATADARHDGNHRPQSLLQAADIALYKAKHAGRNCVATAALSADAAGS